MPAVRTEELTKAIANGATAFSPEQFDK